MTTTLQPIYAVAQAAWPNASADDLNEVRQWLGYGKINLEGGSYGTRMAQTYWRKYPETVRTVERILAEERAAARGLRDAFERATDAALEAQGATA